MCIRPTIIDYASLYARLKVESSRFACCWLYLVYICTVYFVNDRLSCSVTYERLEITARITQVS